MLCVMYMHARAEQSATLYYAPSGTHLSVIVHDHKNINKQIMCSLKQFLASSMRPLMKQPQWEK